MKTLNLKMSKISIPFFIFVAFALIITSCQKTTKCLEVDEKAKAEMLEQIIPLKDAVDQYKDYGKNRVKILKDTLKKKYGKDFSDSRTVWFDLETIKQYILHIEEESEKVGLNPKGLQFYLGVESSKASGKKKNHQTFFIAPTKTDDLESGYTILDGKVVLLKDKLKERYESSPNQRAEKASFFAIMLQEDGLLLNGGRPNPPGGNN